MPLPGYASSTVVDVATDEHGTPLDRFWRARLLDAAEDNCVAVVTPAPEQKSKPKFKNAPEETEQ